MILVFHFIHLKTKIKSVAVTEGDIFSPFFVLGNSKKQFNLHKHKKRTTNKTDYATALDFQKLCL